MTINRRNFIIASAGSAALFAASAPVCAASKKVSWDRTTDVLIFGAGQAGLCAAIAARESKAEVILFEKGAFCGGHTGMSGSGYYIGGTEIQKKAGIDDSVEINWKDSVDRGVKTYRFIKRDTAVVRRVYDEGVAGMAWLEKHGVKFMPKPVQGIGNRRRVHFYFYSVFRYEDQMHRPPKKGPPTASMDLFCWWSRRELNSRLTELPKSFLHAYAAVILLPRPLRPKGSAGRNRNAAAPPTSPRHGRTPPALTPAASRRERGTDEPLN